MRILQFRYDLANIADDPLPKGATREYRIQDANTLQFFTDRDFNEVGNFVALMHVVFPEGEALGFDYSARVSGGRELVLQFRNASDAEINFNPAIATITIIPPQSIAPPLFDAPVPTDYTPTDAIE